MKQRVVILLLALVLVLTACGGELTSEQRMSQTLKALNVSDAQTDTVYTNADVIDPDWISYSSDSNQMVYSFEAETGYLREIQSYGLLDPNDEEIPQEDTSVLSDEERREWILTFAANCIYPNQIGQLQISSEHFSNIDYLYEVTEIYDGIETGTRMMIICNPNGQIDIGVVHIGSVFEKNAFGSYSLVNGDDFIGEEAAIQVALEFVEEQAAENGDTVLPDTAVFEIKAHENKLYYMVTIDTEESDGYVVSYDVQVDVYSGEILFYQFTQ